MTAVAAPVIKAEMDDWVAKGGGNSGIVGDPDTHFYGFHLAANLVSADDYSRWRDPNGSDGPYVDWDFCCAGDFSHKNDPDLRKMHADVLNDLMDGKFPMVCEFIGKPWPDRPVYYWARWNGIDVLYEYTGSGHDHWSHIAWYRSRVDERANLWTGGDMAATNADAKVLLSADGIIKSQVEAGDDPASDKDFITHKTAIERTRVRLKQVDDKVTTIDADLQFVQSKLDRVLEILESGLPLSGEANVSAASVQEISRVVNDEHFERMKE